MHYLGAVLWEHGGLVHILIMIWRKANGKGKASGHETKHIATEYPDHICREIIIWSIWRIIMTLDFSISGGETGQHTGWKEGRNLRNKKES